MLCEISFQNKKIFLLGTAHILKSSVEEVEKTIQDWQPDAIAVELCHARLSSLENSERWKELDIFSILKEGKAGVLLLGLILSGYQKKIGSKLGSMPGMEFMKAVELARQKSLPLILIDRDILITLKRAWWSISFLEKMKFAFSFLFFTKKKDLDIHQLEKLVEEKTVNHLMVELSHSFPTLKKILIDERDQFMVNHLRDLPYQKILGVVGAAHIEGMKKEFDQPRVDFEELNFVAKSYFPFLGFLFPLGIFCFLSYGFYKDPTFFPQDFFLIWVLSHSFLAALGALLALAHPFSILAAFLVSPFTALQPIIKVGWVSGVVEFWLRKPKTKDFQNLSEDVTSVFGFYKNRITRILFVIVFTTLGSAVATLISLPFLFGPWKGG